MLQDQFGRTHDYLRISFTDKCNLKCFYCKPDGNTPIDHALCASTASEKLSSTELLSIASDFVYKMGIKKIRITGGEPLIRKDAYYLIKKLGELPVSLAITTNGAAVGASPSTALDFGVDHTEYEQMVDELFALRLESHVCYSGTAFSRTSSRSTSTKMASASAVSRSRA